MPYKSILIVQILLGIRLVRGLPLVHIIVQQIFEVSELVDEHHEHG